MKPQDIKHLQAEAWRKKETGTVNDCEAQRSHLPDPKRSKRPYRPFTSDPGWSETWWWLGFPLLTAAFVLGSFWMRPEFYYRHLLPEGYGVLEMSHFLIPLCGFVIAAGLLLNTFVRVRPLAWTVALIGALSCLYIAGEEMSWGQHFFHWRTPQYWSAINRQGETNLHNAFLITEGLPRSILEIVVAIGGLAVPIAAAFCPWLRACRISLFLPGSALVPTALGALGFKLVDKLQQSGYITGFLHRPSETIETYLYFFIAAYLWVYARRIKELEQGSVRDQVVPSSAERASYGDIDGWKSVFTKIISRSQFSP